MKIGGPAKYFFIARNEKKLILAISWAKKNKIRWYVVGEGSNLIPNDKGFGGLIIKNEIKNLKIRSDAVLVGAGNNLLKFIHVANKLGLVGMEKMAGIPGTVGGAIFGCAGAYGQEIKDFLVGVKVYNGKTIHWIPQNRCRFTYRKSIFKIKKNWIILEAEFKFKKGDSKKLARASQDIITLREKKYWPGLLCPGSFFKNIVVADIQPLAVRKRFLEHIDRNKVMHGKVAAGYLLELVGAKGTTYGGIKVAEHHGNLLYNSGTGKSSEVEKLAKILKLKTRRRFGIDLEEEIQYL